MDLEIMERDRLKLSHMAQCRGELWAVVSAVMNIRVPQNAKYFLTS
jgi:hypothetical protein